MIIVTGGAGFIGSALVGELFRQGYKDIVVVDSSKDFKNCPNLSPYKEHLLGTFSAWEFLEDKKAKSIYSKISAIFHMGACSSTTEKNLDFLRKNNVEYSQKIFNLAVELGVPLIYASSAATYGNGDEGYSDDHSLLDSLKPLNPYGDSKQAFDIWALAQEKKPPFWCGLKFFNVYGPNEYHKGEMRSLVHKAFHQINERGFVGLFKSYKEPYRDGEQLRDFVYVKDVVKAMILMLKSGDPSYCGVYNLGTGKARSFLDLVRAVFYALEKDPKVEFIDMPDSIRNQYQYFTEAKMDKFHAFLPEFKFSSLEEGVHDYVSHHLSQVDPYYS